MIRCCLITAVLALLACAPSALAAGPPIDYRTNPGLSEPVYAETERIVERIPMHDGKRLYVEIVKPKAPGNWPTILEASPYHGTLADRDGTRILPDPLGPEGKPVGLTGYFAPRGYAVVMVDLRGTGRSDGCLDHLGTNDARDLKRIVEWAANQNWSNGRVGMTGHSYVGSTPSVAAAQNPQGLKTIVPSAGLASMYDHQFQHGVPFFLQWAGPIEAYEQLAIERNLPPFFADPFGLSHPGDNFPPQHPEETGCGLPNSAAVSGEDQLSGRYTESWHQPRDHRAGATNARIPVFLVHGVNDNAARVSAMEWFTQRKAAGTSSGDKLWLGQWDHGSGCCPTRRGLQWTTALHAWFDKHLARRNVDTGPPVEAFLGDGTFQEARTGARTDIYTADEWPPQPTTANLFPTKDGKLSSDPGEPGSVSFTGDAGGHANPRATGGATFRSEPLETDRLFVGQPELNLAASVTVPRVHLIVNLFDEFPDGDTWRRITQCTINPELRNGIQTRETPTPGQRYDMKPQCFAMAHHMKAGHRLVLRVTTSDPDKVPMFAEDPRVTVFTGGGATGLSAPEIPNPTLYPDRFPLGADYPKGPAQRSISCAVTIPVSGAGIREPGITSEFVEFDVLEGHDNAKMKVLAKPATGGDLDLYLQRKKADGSWGDDLASGGSSSLSQETMETGRLAPGRYRVEVHNWAGNPNMQVAVTIDFLNQDGEKGAPGDCSTAIAGSAGLGGSSRLLLTGVRSTRDRFFPSPQPTLRTARRKRVGTTLKWKVSRTSNVTIRFQRVRNGRFFNGRCRFVRRVQLRPRPVCKIYRDKVSRPLRRRSEGGKNKLFFSGRVGRKLLPAHRYRAIFRAKDGREKSNRAATGFRILKR